MNRRDSLWLLVTSFIGSMLTHLRTKNQGNPSDDLFEDAEFTHCLAPEDPRYHKRAENEIKPACDVATGFDYQVSSHDGAESQNKLPCPLCMDGRDRPITHYYWQLCVPPLTYMNKDWEPLLERAAKVRQAQYLAEN